MTAILDKLNLQGPQGRTTLEGLVSVLDPSWLPPLLTFRRQVLESDPGPAGRFVPLPETELADCFRGRGKVVGVLVERNLVAYALLTFPGVGPDNLAKDLGLSEEEQVRSAHIEEIVVHAGYRGQALQATLSEVLMRLARSSAYHIVLSTAAPDNFPSVKNLLRSGLVIKALKPKYGGHWRYIFFSHLLSDPPKYIEEIPVPADDRATQLELLNSGWEGRRFETSQSGSGQIIYAR